MAMLSCSKILANLKFHPSVSVSLVKKSTRVIPSFKFEELKVSLVPESQKKPKPDPATLKFGNVFSDHKFEVEWDEVTGWGIPQIVPFHSITIHPAAKAIHYGQQLFEGLKAFKGPGDKTLLFRPDLNMERMLRTAERSSLPPFDGNELYKCIKKLIAIEKDWIPDGDDCSLYIRPSYIGTGSCLGVAAAKKALLFVILCPVKTYFSTSDAVKLYADPENVRVYPGGTGDMKMGANYASTIAPHEAVKKEGYDQILWLHGDQLTEVGTMNVFVYLINCNGEKELVTPPLNGLILPGVVRQSLLEIARKWNEFKVTEREITIQEVKKSLKKKKLLEIFGSGTACNVCPVKLIHYKGHDYTIPTVSHANPLYVRLQEELADIQYGRKKHEWSVEVE